MRVLEPEGFGDSPLLNPLLEKVEQKHLICIFIVFCFASQRKMFCSTFLKVDLLNFSQKWISWSSSVLLKIYLSLSSISLNKSFFFVNKFEKKPVLLGF